MNGKKKQQPYVVTNWRLIKNAPLELFPTPTFEEFMEERVESWELRGQYVSINRVYNRKTGKVTEKSYQKAVPAQNYLAEQLTKGDLDIATATQTELYHFPADGIDDE